MRRNRPVICAGGCWAGAAREAPPVVMQARLQFAEHFSTYSDVLPDRKRS